MSIAWNINIYFIKKSLWDKKNLTKNGVFSRNRADGADVFIMTSDNADDNRKGEIKGVGSTTFRFLKEVGE